MGTVLDLGCGYGRASRAFTDAGHSYLGIDVSPDAIGQAGLRNSAAAFVNCDLSDWMTTDRFDAVCLFYVLVHFVDDRYWRSMVERSLSWVSDNGIWLIADEFPATRHTPAPHVVQRPLSEYEPILRRRGFCFIDTVPMPFRVAQRL